MAKRELNCDNAERTRANWQIHRFRDCVAVYLANGETRYLTPRAARAIARELNGCARDIEARTFSDSQFGTKHGQTA